MASPIQQKKHQEFTKRSRRMGERYFSLGIDTRCSINTISTSVRSHRKTSFPLLWNRLVNCRSQYCMIYRHQGACACVRFVCDTEYGRNGSRACAKGSYTDNRCRSRWPSRHLLCIGTLAPPAARGRTCTLIVLLDPKAVCFTINQ